MTVREIDQLMVTARHYFSQARRLARRYPTILSMRIADVARHHQPGELHPEELALAHLASCAIRLCTICEKRSNIFPGVYRRMFYNNNRQRKSPATDVPTKIRKSLSDHIHFLLRDNVGHEENIASDMAKDRTAVLEKLSVGEVLSSLESCVKQINAAIT